MKPNYLETLADRLEECANIDPDNCHCQTISSLIAMAGEAVGCLRTMQLVEVQFTDKGGMSAHAPAAVTAPVAAPAPGVTL